MKIQGTITKMMAVASLFIMLLSCTNQDDITPTGNSKVTSPRAVGPWQRTFTDDFNNINNWQKTSRYDYNSAYCRYDAAVPAIGTFDGRTGMILTATKDGTNVWKSGHVKSNYSFKPGTNEEYRVSSQIKFITMNGANYVGFANSYGVWPAFWTVQENSWPVNGEIDIMEGYSFAGSTRFTSNLFYGTSSGNNLLGNTCEKAYGVSEGWHTYDEYWKNQNGSVTVTIQLDGATVSTYTNAINGNLKLQNFGPHNIILNLCVGSNFGIFDNSRINVWTKTMMWVDYVTVDKRTL